MALNAGKAEGAGKSAPALEAGTYPARLVVLADLGLQEQSFQGEKKDPRIQIQTIYELLDEFMVDEDGNEQKDKPRWMWEDFALYNLGSDKAKSTKRYVALDPELKYDGDFTKVVGVPCMLTISVNEGHGKNKGRTFNNISNISTMRSKEADKAPELVGKPLIFDTDEPDLKVFKSLPDAVQTKIKGALDFEGGPLSKLLSGGPSEEEPTEEPNEVSW